MENSLKIPFTGTCQCGGVHYEANKTPIAIEACHCQDCQKLSASAFSITMMIQQDAFRLIRGKLKMFERPTASGGSAPGYFFVRRAAIEYVTRTRTSRAYTGSSLAVLMIRLRSSHKLIVGHRGHSLGMSSRRMHLHLRLNLI